MTRLRRTRQAESSKESPPLWGVYIDEREVFVALEAATTVAIHLVEKL